MLKGGVRGFKRHRASQLEEDISSALDAVLADLDYEHGVWDSVKNMGSPPSLAYLDRRMHMHGQRSEYRDGLKHWICPVCWHNYPPVANLLVDLPLDDCLYCGIENGLDFDFKIFDRYINGVDVSIPVLNQDATPYCTIFSTNSGVSLSRKVTGAMNYNFVAEPLDWTDLLTKYEAKLKVKFGQEAYPDVTRLYHLHSILKTDGVSYKPKSIFHSITNPDNRVFQCSDFWEVDKNDFSYITRLLASGFPLVTSIAVGQKFSTCRSKIYNPPTYHRIYEVGKSSVTHAVLLVGAGRHEGVKYYWLFNSWGPQFGDDGMLKIAHTGILTNPIGMTIGGFL